MAAAAADPSLPDDAAVVWLAVESGCGFWEASEVMDG